MISRRFYANRSNESPWVHCIFSGLHTKVRKPLGIKYIETPVSLGEKIRNKRLELRLLQKDIAHILKVSEDCITNWENNRTEPEIRYFPSIIRFLGYNPWAVDIKSFSGSIKHLRQITGLTHKQMGRLLGVNGSTIGSWEKEEHMPNHEALNHMQHMLDSIIFYYGSHLIPIISP